MAVTPYADETNPLIDGAAYHSGVKREMRLKELVELGGKISRLRILRDRQHYDISYCHAVLPDGTNVRVLGMDMGGDWFRIKRDLVTTALEQGVHAKRVGLLNESNWSVLS